eukprot:CAMPEP_0113702340 /NCGR_PEP_ID=MMETSP0038_2-20120614/25133_1 /TAXON_ID=2898 /ORGANISM="Cryptomonas paramecium" /LENGTH=638 /DNA_ID=CAMNT_0000626447 /DNA_START=128 /DNA_END=2041 /DNA_ORIENTATION=- /assembly_acc=CAM_ASM_000170
MMPTDVVNLAIDCYFMTDTILNFFTAYIDDDTGVMVVYLKEISKHYLGRWFLFDVITSLPLDRLYCLIASGESTSAYSRAIKILRFFKMFRFFRMLRLVNRVEEIVGSWISNSILLCKFLFVLLLVGHVWACIWHFVIELNGCTIPADVSTTSTIVCGCEPSNTTSCRDYNWLARYDREIYEGNDNVAKYLISFYYCVVTLTTLGYGDVLPMNQFERGFSTAMALTGAVSFSFLINNISRIVAKSNMIEAAAQERLTALTDLCGLRTVPRESHDNSRRSIHYLNNHAPHLLSQVVRTLPRSHRNDLVHRLTDELMRNFPLFQTMSRDCRARIAELLRPCVYTPGTEIYGPLDAATEMYFVMKGEVAIFEVSEIMKCRYGPGAIVGVMEMFPDLMPKEHCYRLLGARARNKCNLLELRREDLEGTIRTLFPDIYDALHSLARELLRNVDKSKAVRAMNHRIARRCGKIHDMTKKEADLHSTIQKTRSRSSNCSPIPSLRPAREEALGDLAWSEEEDGMTSPMSRNGSGLSSIAGEDVAALEEAVANLDDLERQYEELGGDQSVGVSPDNSYHGGVRRMAKRGVRVSPALPAALLGIGQAPPGASELPGDGDGELASSLASRLPTRVGSGVGPGDDGGEG